MVKAGNKFLIGGLLVLLCGTLQRCGSAETASAEKTTPLEQGDWEFVFYLDRTVQLPISCSILFEDSMPLITIKNGKESIDAQSARFEGDSLFFRMPYYDSEFRMLVLSSTAISGNWFNYAKGPNYLIPIEGRWVEDNSTAANEPAGPIENIAGSWEATFSVGRPDTYKALGIFEQDGERVTGTFATETGDYRFLSGKIIDSLLTLSCFDGSHAFLFTAIVGGDSLRDGKFRSGVHWGEAWGAMRNANFSLRHADSLTYTREGYGDLKFSFPDLAGHNVEMQKSDFEGRVSIIQIMGSWCPNCIDESIYYTDLFNKNKEQGLQIVSISYEVSDEFEKAVKSVTRMKDQLGINYTLLIGGKASKKKSAEDFPMLTDVLSYPTSIFIDKKGKIRKIHTGFSGPGTGVLYDKYVDSTNSFVAMLLAE